MKPDKIEPAPCMRVGGPGHNSLWSPGDADGARVEVHERGVIAYHTWSCFAPVLMLPAYAVPR